MNNGNLGGRTQFFNYKANDPAFFYSAPLTFTTGETKKINGFLYFRVKNQWFSYTMSTRSANLNNPNKQVSTVVNIRNRGGN